MKLYYKMIFIFFVLTLFSSCVSHSEDIIYLNSIFDIDQAKAVFEEGTNNISGAAYLRKPDGVVITASNSEVWLFSATKYTTERIKNTYGNIESGYLSMRGKSKYKRGDLHNSNKSVVNTLEFEPDYDSYYSYVRKIKADYLGHFVFDKIVDGDYYIITTLLWEDMSSSAGFLLPMPLGFYLLDEISLPYKNGGTLMQRVSVKGGETKTIEMTP